MKEARPRYQGTKRLHCSPLSGCREDRDGGREGVDFLSYQHLTSYKLHTGVSQAISMYSACVLSRFSHVQLSATLWTMARQVPLPMGFSR